MSPTRTRRHARMAALLWILIILGSCGAFQDTSLLLANQTFPRVMASANLTGIAQGPQLRTATFDAFPEILWAYASSGERYIDASSVVGANGTLLVPVHGGESENAKLVAIDPDNGTRLAEYDFGEGAQRVGHIAVGANGTVFAVAGGSVVALDLIGSAFVPRWSLRIGLNDTEDLAETVSLPVTTMGDGSLMPMSSDSPIGGIDEGARGGLALLNTTRGIAVAVHTRGNDTVAIVDASNGAVLQYCAASAPDGPRSLLATPDGALLILGRSMLYRANLSDEACTVTPLRNTSLAPTFAGVDETNATATLTLGDDGLAAVLRGTPPDDGGNGAMALFLVNATEANATEAAVTAAAVSPIPVGTAGLAGAHAQIGYVRGVRTGAGAFVVVRRTGAVSAEVVSANGASFTAWNASVLSAGAQASGRTLSAPPTVGLTGVLYVVDSSGSVHGIDAFNGTARWTLAAGDTAGHVAGNAAVVPLADGDAVITGKHVGSANTIVAARVTQAVWPGRLGRAGQNSFAPMVQPALCTADCNGVPAAVVAAAVVDREDAVGTGQAKEVALTGVGGGFVVAADGTVMYVFSKYLSRIFPNGTASTIQMPGVGIGAGLTSTPTVLADGAVAAVTSTVKLVIARSVSPVLSWSANTSSVVVALDGTPWGSAVGGADSTVVYVATYVSVSAYSTTNSSLIWQFVAGAGVRCTPPALGPRSLVLIQCTNRKAYALNSYDGSTVATLTGVLDGVSPERSPVVVGGVPHSEVAVLKMATGDRVVYDVRLTTRQANITRSGVGVSIVGEVALSDDGFLYLMESDGALRREAVSGSTAGKFRTAGVMPAGTLTTAVIGVDGSGTAFVVYGRRAAAVNSQGSLVSVLELESEHLQFASSVGFARRGVLAPNGNGAVVVAVHNSTYAAYAMALGQPTGGCGTLVCATAALPWCTTRVSWNTTANAASGTDAETGVPVAASAVGSRELVAAAVVGAASGQPSVQVWAWDATLRSMVPVSLPGNTTAVDGSGNVTAARVAVASTAAGLRIVALTARSGAAAQVEIFRQQREGASSALAVGWEVEATIAVSSSASAEACALVRTAGAPASLAFDGDSVEVLAGYAGTLAVLSGTVGRIPSSGRSSHVPESETIADGTVAWTLSSTLSSPHGADPCWGSVAALRNGRAIAGAPATGAMVTAAGGVGRVYAWSRSGGVGSPWTSGGPLSASIVAESTSLESDAVASLKVFGIGATLVNNGSTGVVLSTRSIGWDSSDTSLPSGPAATFDGFLSVFVANASAGSGAVVGYERRGGVGRPTGLPAGAAVASDSLVSYVVGSRIAFSIVGASAGGGGVLDPSTAVVVLGDVTVGDGGSGAAISVAGLVAPSGENRTDELELGGGLALTSDVLIGTSVSRSGSVGRNASVWTTSVSSSSALSARGCVCGDGIVSGTEACDSASPCCTGSCQFASNTTVCRAATSECDVAELCPGDSTTCPADAFANANTACGRASSCLCAAGGICKRTGFPDTVIKPCLYASEYDALREFYVALDGAHWKNTWPTPDGSNELTGYACEEWQGVTCNGSRVSDLELSARGLTGSIPYGVFGRLPALERLNLSDNAISGSLPSDLHSCVRLTSLDVSNNSFTNRLPGVSAWTSLSTLRVQRNGFNNDDFLVWLGDAPALQHVNASHNSFSGAYGVRYGTLRALSELDLSSNARYNASFSASMARLGNLTLLDASATAIYGGLTDTVYSMSALTTLRVSSVNLGGGFDERLVQLQALEDLRLSDAQLSGVIPDAVTQLPSLRILDLSDNSFTVYPTNISALAARNTYVDLRENDLACPYPFFRNDSDSLHLDECSVALLGDVHLNVTLPSGLSVANVTISFTPEEAISGSAGLRIVLPIGYTYQPTSRIYPVANIPGSFGTPLVSNHVISAFRSGASAQAIAKPAGERAAVMALDGGARANAEFASTRTRTGDAMRPLRTQSSGTGAGGRTGGRAAVRDADARVRTLALDPTVPARTANVTVVVTDVFAATTFATPEFRVQMAVVTEAGFQIMETYEHLPCESDNSSESCATVIEKEALVALYNATGGPAWRRTWDTSQNPCSELYPYRGVGCLGDAVSSLALPANNLAGPLPTAMGNLTHLSTVFLHGNKLNGTIPAALFDARFLHVLWLEDNEFSGALPDRFDATPLLQSLRLGHNRLSGPIPASLGSLGKLTELHLEGNEFSGEIPESLFAMRQLTYVGLGSNNLTGALSGAGIANWTNVTEISLSSNNFTGTLPAEFGLLAALDTFSVRRNPLLGGPIPAAFFANKSDLRSVDMSACSFSGPLPDAFASAPLLRLLTLSDNAISGGLPASLLSLEHVSELDIRRNALNESLPASFASMLSLRTLRLSGNALLGGALPTAFPSHLTLIEADDCQLSGAISGALTNSSSVGFVRVRRNFLQHNGPLVFGHGAMGLSLFDFSDNPLNASLDASVSNARNLGTLMLRNTSLHGALPSALGSLQHLFSLDLSENALSGSIPEDVGNWTRMLSLDLSLNSLSGPLPESLGTLPGAPLLNLSYNAFTSMPSSFADLIARGATVDLRGNGATIPCPYPVNASAAAAMGLPPCSVGLLANATAGVTNATADAANVAFLVGFETGGEGWRNETSLAVTFPSALTPESGLEAELLEPTSLRGTILPIVVQNVSARLIRNPAVGTAAGAGLNESAAGNYSAVILGLPAAQSAVAILTAADSVRVIFGPFSVGSGGLPSNATADILLALPQLLASPAASAENVTARTAARVAVGCASGHSGSECESCAAGYFVPTNATRAAMGLAPALGFDPHVCEACGCDTAGSVNTSCSAGAGSCFCKSGYAGRSCNLTNANTCNSGGTIGEDGICSCSFSRRGLHCEECRAGLYANWSGSGSEATLSCETCDSSCLACRGPGPTNCTACDHPLALMPNGTCATAAACPANSSCSSCGDGVVSGDEQCDTAIGSSLQRACCDTDCRLRLSNVQCLAGIGCESASMCNGTSPACPARAPAPAGTLCRAAVSGCDAAEYCNGTSTECPADEVAANGTVCRAAAGDCDIAEVCNGTSAACPPDRFKLSSTVCRPVAGVCDVAEFCTGSSAPCPADAFQNSSVACRTANGVCDVTDYCNGTSAACPADAFANSSVVCRAASGDCDVAEHCNGTSASCPANAFANSSVVCRAASGDCDVAEYCNGTSTSCPANAFANSSVVCRAASGDCDVAEYCNGTSTSCPADAFLNSSVVCRAASGDCDIAENCTGSSAVCPADAFLNSSVLCRVALGDCDVAEHCNGTSASCPADAFLNSSVVCRAANGSCDVAEHCKGTSASCPVDAFANSSVVCRAANGSCDVAELCTGASALCPTDTFANSSVVCRAANGSCDVAELCTGASALCPTDTFANSSVVCRAANGSCDVAELCTGASALCPTDAFLNSSVVCRAANGSCDVAELCTGASALCPADAFLNSSVECRAANGSCDVAEHCTGSSASCPADAYVNSSVVCRAANGSCDVAEHCTGASASCPADAYLNSSAVCRTANGSCDVAEHCTGSSASCPADAFLNSSVVCRAANGSCDIAEHCTGSSASCPADAFLNSSVVCRAANGSCDTAEHCTGSSASCPANAFVNSSVVCRASAGDCDVAEQCTGSSASCPADVLANSSVICRAAAGDCDVAEHCSGSSASCPADAFLNSSVVCRSANGSCDVAEHCTGSSASCPADAFLNSSVVCRPSAGDCDVAEHCTGSSASCPLDAFLNSSVVCRMANGSCDIAEHCTGSSASCPADAFLNSSVVCRASAGDCDVAEHCTGSSASCPADVLANSSVICRAAAGDCDVAEHCSGSSASCPANAFANSSVVCRSANGSCDIAEHCTGSSASCPADAFLNSSVVCRASAGDCDVAEQCTGSSASCPADAFVNSSVVCRMANGSCDTAEQCTGSSASCPADGFLNSSVVCRAANGSCDVAEHCTGSSASCPVDALANSSVVCRVANGSCDVAEHCTGSSASCPADAFLNSSVVCRAANGSCDIAEHCTGSSASCPADAFLNSSVVCRPSAGDCDVAEQCTGSSASCPADAFVNSSVVCRVANGSCDVAEHCTGSSASCPADAFLNSSVVCRAANGSCDVAEHCTGSSASCPADAYLNSSTECRAAAGDCDITEQCTGASASCPADAFRNSSVVCRAANGSCDVAEHCTGSSASCPADAFLNSSVECRAAAGDCDVAEQCTGSSASCPANAFLNSSVVCRAAVGDCDVAEHCTGSSASCPANAFANSSVVCRAANGSCDIAEHCTGSSASCPADAFRNSSVVCRAANGSCDIVEHCTGSSASCPADAFRNSSVVCRAANGSCDVVEHCTGSSASCPADAFRNSSVVCRAANGSCDVVEHCTGSSASCPADAFRNNSVVCRAANGSCDIAEHCTGSSASCPADTFLNASVVCRAANGSCDVAEHCTGSSASCPADTFLNASVVCRVSTGSCDAAENCTGSSASCPADAFLDSSVVCRSAAGPCDVPESCDGVQAACPVNRFANSSVVCRASAGKCDIAETCTGASTQCPRDQLHSAGTVCRAAAGPCDLAENCTGSSAACLPDSYRVNGSACLPPDGGPQFDRPGACQSGVCEPQTARCGDGVVDDGEECDGGVCCTVSCTFKPMSQPCRAAAGPCDVAEYCTGTSALCPVNQLLPSTSECRPAGGPCDVTEFCTGLSPNCPSNMFRNSSTVCRMAVGLCDVAEHCPGTVAECPADAVQPDGSVCRSASAPCELDATCNGNSSSCPSLNPLASSATVCRATQGPCDEAERCNGTSRECPPDEFAPATQVCRAAASSCDLAETCTGNSSACPANAFAANGTVCGTTGNGRCTGASAVCRGDVYFCGDGAVGPGEECDGGLCCTANCTLKNSTVECRAAAGPCDVAEMCSGSSAFCPDDALRNRTFICRPATGPCDLAETCTGASTACPADVLRNSSFVCREAAGLCDIAEHCTGASGVCPPDALRPVGHVCRAAAGLCDLAESCSGVGAGCPPDALRGNGTLCRPAAGVCDIAEYCNGTSVSCPLNAFLPSTHTCRNASALCDAPENCTGVSPSCPSDSFLPPTAVCRPAAGVCDAPEHCLGNSSACPPDVFFGFDQPCNRTDQCGFPLRCSGTSATECTVCVPGEEFRKDRCQPCKIGTYGPSGVSCAACPNGARCPAPATTIASLETRAGFWRSGIQATTFFECERAAACPGGAGAANATCASGHAGPVCALCDEDHFRVGELCLSCPSESASIVGLLAIVVVLGSFLALLFRADAPKYDDFDGAAEQGGGTFANAVQRDSGVMGAIRSRVTKPRDSRTTVTFAKVFIGFLQVLAAASALDIPWPEAFDFLGALAGVVQLDFIQVSSLECLRSSPLSLEALMALTITIPTGIALLLRIQFMFAVGRSGPGEGERHRARFWKNIALLCLAVYPAVSRRALEAYPCRTVSGTRYVRADFSLLCDGETHRRLVGGGALITAVVTLGLPSLVLWYLRKHRNELGVPEVLSRVGLLTMDYRRSFPYWEVVRALHKVAYWVVVALIPGESATQAVAAYLLSLVSLMGHLVARPFVTHEGNALEFAALVAEYVTFFLGLLLRVSVTEEGGLTATVGLLLVNLVVILFLGRAMLVSLRITGSVIASATGALFRGCGRFLAWLSGGRGRSRRRGAEEGHFALETIPMPRHEEGGPSLS